MSTFVSRVAGATVKAVATSLAVALVLVSVMHYMGVPVPSAHELLGGLTRLVRLT